MESDYIVNSGGKLRLQPVNVINRRMLDKCINSIPEGNLKSQCRYGFVDFTPTFGIHLRA